MEFNFPEAIGRLSPDQRLRFYELLAHNLTVAIRAIWSDEDPSDSEKIDRIKWVNEILHRVTDKIGVIRLNLHEWTEIDTWRMIEGYMGQNRSISVEIMFAIKCSYDSVCNDEGRV